MEQETRNIREKERNFRPGSNLHQRRKEGTEWNRKHVTEQEQRTG